MAKRTAKPNSDLIRSIPLFSTVSDEACAEVAAASSLHEVAARAVLFSEDGKPDNLYILLKGSVELFSEHDERYCTLGIAPALRPLALCSIRSDHNVLSARALEDSELIVVPAQLVITLFAREPAFASAVIDELAIECHELVEDFKNHRLRSTIERVAHWMLRGDRKSGDTGHIVIPFDKRVLASYLGMAPEHLSRSFSALSSAGVQVHGRSVTLNNRAALSEAAGMDVPERFLQPAKKS